jgi:hypothetical protein
MAATSVGSAKRWISDDGRAVLKNSCSTCAVVLADPAGRSGDERGPSAQLEVHEQSPYRVNSDVRVTAH